jgi:uncharacterized protein YcfJ
MRTKLVLAALATLVITPEIAGTIATSAAMASDHSYTYRGRDGRYYRHCKRSSGTTGLVAGAAGGALVGNALGGGVLGTVAGGVGGGLLGKHLDKKHDAAQNRRNGCA